MNDFRTSVARGGTLDASINEGLRTFMLGVYGKLALGLLLTGVLAYVAGTVPVVTELVFNSPLKFVVQFGPIALILISMFAMLEDDEFVILIQLGQRMQ